MGCGVQAQRDELVGRASTRRCCCRGLLSLRDIYDLFDIYDTVFDFVYGVYELFRCFLRLRPFLRLRAENVNTGVRPRVRRRL